MVLVVKMEVRNLEQHAAIKVCAKRSNLAMQICGKILEVYDNDFLNCAQVSLVQEKKHGCETVKEKAGSGRPVEVQTDTNVQHIQKP